MAPRQRTGTAADKFDHLFSVENCVVPVVLQENCAQKLLKKRQKVTWPFGSEGEQGKGGSFCPTRGRTDMRRCHAVKTHGGDTRRRHATATPTETCGSNGGAFSFSHAPPSLSIHLRLAKACQPPHTHTHTPAPRTPHPRPSEQHVCVSLCERQRV